MSRKPKQSSLLIDYNEKPILAIPGIISVTSTNEHGYHITTNHFYARGAEYEREQRARQGHQVSNET